MNKLSKFSLGLSAMMFSALSFAEIDLTAATTTISTDGSTAITGIGTALVTLAALAVVFKWAKGAVFG